MQAEIISIGTELTLGHIVNTNAAYIYKKLASIGIEAAYETTVADNKERLSFLLRQALGRSEVVITIGGLGPTIDDITTETISEVTSKQLLYNKTIANLIKRHYNRRNIKDFKDAIRQAYIPKGAKWVENEVGTAAALILEEDQQALIALPGPPHELKPIFEKNIIPYLSKRFKNPSIIKSRTIKLTGLSEAEIHSKIRALLKLTGDVTMGIYVHLGAVDLRIMARAKNVKAADKLIVPVERKIRSKLKRYIYGTDDETLEEVVGNLLRKKKKTLSVAESCTGGLIANRITDVPGSSGYFKMGAIAYSDKVKNSLLGVPTEIIKKHGAVSRQVALLLARGVRNKAAANMGVGVTGIAGPTGARKAKPVGLVFIAVSTAKKETVRKFNFTGSRRDIKIQASTAALNMIRLNV